MNLVITGDVDPQKTIELVAKNFHSTKTRKEPIYEEKITPINKTIRKDFLSNKATSTEIMLAFSGPKNNDTKSKIIFDIVNEYLNSTNVGIQQELKKLNSSTNMGLEKISTNANNPTIVFYNFNSSEENSEKVLKLIYDKLTSIKSPSNEELEVIKKRLAIAHQNNLQYSLAVNNMIGNSIINGEFHSLEEYTNIINSK